MGKGDTMSDIIKITYDGKGPIVSGRELHEFLEVETPYHIWFPRMAEYGFADGTDYAEVMNKNVQNPIGGRPATDHALTLDMAKELAMIQRTERGKQARQYFIQVEKDFNSPEKVMARALLIADETIKGLSAQLQIAAPKVEFYDTVADCGDTKSMDEVAKLIGIPGWGRNTVFALLRDINMLRDNNQPYQGYIDRGYFELIEQTPWKDREGHVHIPTKTVVTQKGIEHIARLVKEAAASRKRAAN
jgi:anti-repressor protein